MIVRNVNNVNKSKYVRVDMCEKKSESEVINKKISKEIYRESEYNNGLAVCTLEIQFNSGLNLALSCTHVVVK